MLVMVVPAGMLAPNTCSPAINPDVVPVVTVIVDVPFPVRAVAVAVPELKVKSLVLATVAGAERTSASRP